VWGSLGERDICKPQKLRGCLRQRGETASFVSARRQGVRALDLFFKKQIEECRELARHAVDAEDRAFWQQAAARWEDQLRSLLRETPGRAGAPNWF